MLIWLLRSTPQHIPFFFLASLETLWTTFKETSGKVDTHKFEVIRKILLVGQVRCGFPWAEVDFVYFPCFSHHQSHWFLVVLDINMRTLTLYDSMIKRRPITLRLGKLLSPWYSFSLTCWMTCVIAPIFGQTVVTGELVVELSKYVQCMEII